MYCNCGVKYFVYQTLEKEGDFYQCVLISKCGLYLIDGKKKSKCDFYNKKILKTGIVIDSPIIIKKEHEKYIKYENLDSDKKSRKEIESNIHLLKIAEIYPVNISNYISLINYNLRKLHYKPFFLNKESIEQLVKRLESKPDYIKSVKSDFIYKSKTRKNKVKTSINSVDKYSSVYIIRDDDDGEDEYSDDSEEGGDEFDVECYDSLDENDIELENEALDD
tara:strand:- start:7962 stop:8624 length:663 start_codon:yes stop_codon:yes gene_type:complete